MLRAKIHVRFVRAATVACALFGAAFNVSFATDSLLVFHGPANRPFLNLSATKHLRLGLDGLVDSVRLRAKPMGSSVLAFTCTGDTLDAFLSVPEDGKEPDKVRVAGPCDFQGFTGRLAPASPYDFMLFGDKAALPWVKLRLGERSVFAPLPSLRLRRAAPESIRFQDPMVIRVPFLLPLLGRPLDADSNAIRFRVIDGMPRREAAKADSIVGWNWSVVADQGGNRLRVDSRNLPHGYSVWSAALGSAKAVLVFEDSYRREPRKAAAFRTASGKRYMTLEIATLFGHGVWTDLWTVGPDTAWTTRIGVVDGESDENWQGTWKLDRKRGIVTTRVPGKNRIVFRAP